MHSVLLFFFCFWLDVICSNVLLHCLFISVLISECQNLSLWDLLDGSIVIMIKDLCLSVIIHAYHPLTNSCWIRSLNTFRVWCNCFKMASLWSIHAIHDQLTLFYTYEIHAPLSKPHCTCDHKLRYGAVMVLAKLHCKVQC